MSDRADIPKLETRWKHYKGNEYTVYDVTNADADPGRNVDHPISVSYRGDNGKRWSKPLDLFLEKMTPVAAKGMTEPALVSKTARPVLTAPADLGDTETCQLERPIPQFNLIADWKTVPGGPGANLFVDATYIGSGIEADDKQALVIDCWKARQVHTNRVDMHAAVKHHLDRWSFCTLTRAQQDFLNETGVGFITNNRLPPRGESVQIVMVSSHTTLGGSVRDMVTLVALLRQVRAESQFADSLTMFRICAQFNESARREVSLRNAFENTIPEMRSNGLGLSLTLLIPTHTMYGPQQDHVRPYLSCAVFFDQHKLVIDLPRDITECITALFGSDCLQGDFRD